MKAPLLASLLLSAVVFASITARAAVPQPDHLVFGTIAIDGRAITRTDTDVVIEARRGANGPVLASYRMGSSTRLGDHYYALRLTVANSAADATAKDAILGESLVLTVRNTAGVAHQVTHPVTEPGVAFRLDFGASVDTDGNGIPDGWEIGYFGKTGGDSGRDGDIDGASNLGEYNAGTHPLDPTDVFRLAIQIDGALLRVSFRALPATGVGYESRTRYYALETTDDPVSGRWQPVENFNRITGANQLVVFGQPNHPETPAFFRARVWLE